MTDKCKFKRGDKVVYGCQIGIVECISIGWKPAQVRVVFKDKNEMWVDSRFLEFHNAPERVVFT